MRRAILVAFVMLLVAGCSADQQNGRIDPATDNQKEDSIIPIIKAENERVENEMSRQDAGALSPWAVEYLEQFRKTNVESVIRGNYTPANRDADMRNIERFVFHIGSWDGIEGLVMDRLHSNRVYFDNIGNVPDYNLESIPYSAELRDEDFERLIAAIEASGLRDWEVFYRGQNPEGALDGGWGWAVGILFADGTMLRSGGSGMAGVTTPPDEQFSILTDFIATISEEIIERHNAEQAAAQKDEQDG